MLIAFKVPDPGVRSGLLFGVGLLSLVASFSTLSLLIFVLLPATFVIWFAAVRSLTLAECLLLTVASATVAGLLIAGILGLGFFALLWIEDKDPELFDVVIFDEASQIPPAEAIGALARAKQAVVAGDDRQLPPTSFFRSQQPEDYGDESDDADDGVSLVSNIESLLDVVKGLPIKEQMLQWHYRSRDGRLITFSNNHIYGEAMTAFPGTALEFPVC